ncbi:hypothetical protein T492DRAFT_847456 [Pavlovales sp. CCMP2436]|nr:hypothetical protein T492DRAFT_847456 [Pavlovales sp. CCMP2436]
MSPFPAVAVTFMMLLEVPFLTSSLRQRPPPPQTTTVAVAFMMLFKPEMLEDESYQGANHKTILESLTFTFTAGIFGDFEMTTFDDGMMNALMGKTLFFFFMVITGVVALNALIAFLSDSYAQVQERQAEATLSLKASLIVCARPETWT